MVIKNKLQNPRFTELLKLCKTFNEAVANNKTPNKCFTKQV